MINDEAFFRVVASWGRPPTVSPVEMKILAQARALSDDIFEYNKRLYNYFFEQVAASKPSADYSKQLQDFLALCTVIKEGNKSYQPQGFYSVTGEIFSYLFSVKKQSTGDYHDLREPLLRFYNDPCVETQAELKLGMQKFEHFIYERLQQQSTIHPNEASLLLSVFTENNFGIALGELRLETVLQM